MTNSINYTAWGVTYTLTPRFDKYTNGRLAIILDYADEEMDMLAPFAKVTVNMPDIHLNEGEVLIKDWSENEPLVEFLVEEGLLIPTGREVASGYIFPMVARLGGILAEGVK